MRQEGEEFSEEKTRNFFRKGIGRESLLILVAESQGSLVGVSAVFVSDCFFSESKVATELLWHTDDKLSKITRMKITIDLYEKMFQWCLYKQAKILKFACPDWSKSIEKLLKRNGFTLEEQMYRKAV